MLASASALIISAWSMPNTMKPANMPSRAPLSVTPARDCPNQWAGKCRSDAADTVQTNKAMFTSSNAHAMAALEISTIKFPNDL